MSAARSLTGRFQLCNRVAGLRRCNEPLNNCPAAIGVMRPPFDLGHGYYGVELGALEKHGRYRSVSPNRLFRLPILLHQPLGVATDILTNGAMIICQPSTDANRAAAAALSDAELNVPPLTADSLRPAAAWKLQAAHLAAGKTG